VHFSKIKLVFHKKTKSEHNMLKEIFVIVIAESPNFNLIIIAIISFLDIQSDAQFVDINAANNQSQGAR
jgi:hypothetical protein